MTQQGEGEARKRCSLARMTFECKHHNEKEERRVGTEWLGVVCDRDCSKEYSLSTAKLFHAFQKGAKILDEKVEEPKSRLGKALAAGEIALKKEWSSHDEGGTDAVTISGQLISEESGGDVHGDPPWGAWTSMPRTVHVSPPQTPHSLWPMSDLPREISFTGKACDDVTCTGVIRVYPDPRYSIELKIEIFEKIADRINGAIKKFLETLVRQLPINLKLKLKLPEGKCKLTWGWEEDAHSFKTFFALKGDIGIDPLFGIFFDCSLSALSAIGTSLGLPPAVGKFLGKYIVDVEIGVRMDISTSFTFAGELRRYYDGRIGASGKAPDLAVTGKFSIYIAAHAGHEYVISIEGEGRLTVELKAKANLSLDRTGLYFQPALFLPKIAGILTVKTRYLYFFGSEKEREWVIYERETPILEAEKYRLLPPESEEEQEQEQEPGVCSANQSEN